MSRKMCKRSADLLSGQFSGHLIARKDVALALGVAERTLIGWATKGKGPDVVKVGSRVYYFRKHAEALCAARGKALPSPAMDNRQEESQPRAASQHESKLFLDIITRTELARILNVSERTLKAWAAACDGPPYAKIGRATVYRREAVVAWLRTRVRGNEPLSNETQREIASSPSEPVGDPPPIL